MPEPYPNHLISIPRSIASLKHYFRVHDQPFTRGLLYLVILALALTALGLVVSVVGCFRDASSQARTLKEKLSVLRFEGGKAAAAVEQPCVLWEDVQVVPFTVKRESGRTERQERRAMRMLVVLDTTGKLDTWQKAAEHAGCPEPARFLFFGTEQIEALEPKKSRETKKYSYSNKEKVAEFRKLIEDNGRKLPEVTGELDVSKLGLEPGKLHVLVHTSALMALVDTTGKKRTMEKALEAEYNRDKEFRKRFDRPLFLVLVTGSAVTLKPRFAAEPRTWEFSNEPGISSEALADWIASTARQSRMSVLLREALPSLMSWALVLFIGAFIFSVPGLIVNGVLRAGLAFGELLTIGIYATTPAIVAFLVGAFSFPGQGNPLVLGIAIIVGAVYAALGAHRTARALEGGGAPSL